MTRITDTQRGMFTQARTAAATAGDNHAAAIYEIAIDGELSQESIDGLTEQQYKEVVKEFADVGGLFGWDRAKAITAAEDMANRE